MRARTTRFLSLLACLIVGPGAQLRAQGPEAAYFLNPATELAWAHARIVVGARSGFDLPFLPVVVRPAQAPLGSHGYADAIDVDAPLLFAGNGRSANGYASAAGPLEVEGCAVLVCYDCGGSVEGGGAEALAMSLTAAAQRGAAAVVLFSAREERPFLTVAAKQMNGFELPTITVTRTDADRIFATDLGAPRVAALATADAPPPGMRLHARLLLHVDSGFERLETEHFEIRFGRDAFSSEQVRVAAAAHEKALETILAALAPEETAIEWPRSRVVYFDGHDSKVFFTHHWGWGLSNDAGSFLVWDGTEPEHGVIVHEHTHDFTHRFWGGSSSFVDEGVASWVEALATDPDENHADCRRFLEAGKLPALAEMVGIDVGSDPLTPFAYPAGGSFVGYLVETCGLDRLRQVFEAENRTGEAHGAEPSWQDVLGRSLAELDSAWRAWLGSGNAHPEGPR